MTGEAEGRRPGLLDGEVGARAERLLDRVLVARCLEFTLVAAAERGETPGPIHSAAGHEWVASVLAEHLTDADWLAPHYRSHPWYLSRGHSWRDLLAMVIAPRRAGDDVLHLRPRADRLLTPSGIVGQQIPVGAGLAAALQARGEHAASVVSCGDGALTIGLLTETLVGAVANGLPLLVVIEDNQVQNFARTSEVAPSSSPAGLAAYCGAAHLRVTADDLPGALEAAAEALDLARGGRPTVLDARVTLEHPHLIRPGGGAIVARGLDLPEPRVVNDHVLALAAACGRDRDSVETAAAALLAEMAPAAAAAWEGAPDPIDDDRPGPRSPLRAEDLATAADGATIREWVDSALRRSEGIWISQAGVREANGPVGSARTLEMPIAERAMMGFGLGARLAGLRAVVDVSVLNFALVGLDVLGLGLPTLSTRSPGPLAPLLVVGAVGAGHRVGEQHDWDSLDLLCSLPVDRVVVPGTRRQATALVARWWDTDETWLLALPMAVMLETGAEVTAPPATPDDDLVLATWGRDLRDTAQAAALLASEGTPTAVVQIIDVSDPGAALDRIGTAATVVVVAAEADGASVVPRVRQALEDGASRRIVVHHRPRRATGPDDVVEAVHALVAPIP